MTRQAFKAHYRIARVTLAMMSDLREPVEHRKTAEATWIKGIKGINGPNAAAYRAVVARLDLPESISSRAIFDFRFCGGHRKAWYIDTFRAKRALSRVA